MAEGYIKVTRETWLQAAQASLIRDEVDTVKVLPLAAPLKLSRSKVYWYFKGLDALSAAPLDRREERTTQPIPRHSGLAVGCVNEAACNFFRCLNDPRLFDRGLGLDCAVRGRTGCASAH